MLFKSTLLLNKLVDMSDNLLSQLSSFGFNQPRLKRDNDDIELTKDNLEEFILNYSSRLVKGSVESMENMKDFIDSAPDAESAEALASMIKSTASTIDILQRILIAREKNKSAKELTQMKIESQQMQTDKDIAARLLLTREEAIKALIASTEDRETIEAEVTIVDGN